RKRHRYDPSISDARPWLYGIAANLIGKHSRAEVRMLRAYARSGADPVLAGAFAANQAEEADSRVSSAAVRRELAVALAGLAAGGPPGGRPRNAPSPQYRAHSDAAGGARRAGAARGERRGRKGAGDERAQPGAVDLLQDGPVRVPAGHLLERAVDHLRRRQDR